MIKNAALSKERLIIISIMMLMSCQQLIAQHKAFIIVDQTGNGDFTSLTAAINSLPMFNYERKTIFVKNGVYEEKIRLDQDNITLQGEDRIKTIIQFNQLRSDWDRAKDSIGPAVINLHADDIIIRNLTIQNTQPEIGPHAFAIYGTGTRTIILNCNVFSKGGDTVSLWNYKTGMYYHADCHFQGAVDFVCPRGWCFIKNSEFYEYKETAAIWHAGGFQQDQKFVIVNSRFDGVPGFKLGRHHYEAQFYLLNCQFSETMSDEPIYRVTYPDDPSRNRPFNWGERYYFHNCHREAADFGWFKDNLSTAEGLASVEDITAAWTFNGSWDPETNIGPRIVEYHIIDNEVLFRFDEQISVIGTPLLESESGSQFRYKSGGGSDTIGFTARNSVEKKDLAGLKIRSGGKLSGTIATVRERPADLNINIQ